MYCFCYLLPTKTKSWSIWRIVSRFLFGFRKQTRHGKENFLTLWKNYLHNLILFLYFHLQKWFFLSLSIVSSTLVFLLSTACRVYMFSFNSQSFFIFHNLYHTLQCTIKLLIDTIATIATFVHLVFTTEQMLTALIRLKFAIIFIALIISTLLVAKLVWCKIKWRMYVIQYILDDAQFKEY